MTFLEILTSVAVYMIALVFVTEYLKKWLNVHPLLLSWAVGLLLCVAWWAVFRQMSAQIVAGMIVITGATNSAYKVNFAGLKRVVKKWLVKGVFSGGGK